MAREAARGRKGDHCVDDEDVDREPGDGVEHDVSHGVADTGPIGSVSVSVTPSRNPCASTCWGRALPDHRGREAAGHRHRGRLSQANTAGWWTSPNDGRTGLSMGMQSDYDVICIDIMLPALNGYDVLKHLWPARCGHRSSCSRPGRRYDQTDAFELGADDYVTKPFHTSVLAWPGSLRSPVAAPRERPWPELAVGDPVLNPATHRVYRGSDEITLTAREFALLQHFMRHPEVVLSKTTLLEEVGLNYPGADNVVEVYVGYLRKGRSTPFDVISLETVRVRGYRLVPVSLERSDHRPLRITG